MSICGVVFDFGGVVCRAEDESGRRKWEGILGLPPGRLPEIVFGSEAARDALLGRVAEAEIWAQMARLFGLDPLQTTQLRSDFWSGHRVDDRLVRFITDLRSQYTTAILSNFWTGARDRFARFFGLSEDLVDYTFISCEVGLIKPDAAIYLLACEQMRLDPGQVLFVDDAPENVAGACACGLHGLLFTETERIIAETDALLRRRITHV